MSYITLTSVDNFTIHTNYELNNRKHCMTEEYILSYKFYATDMHHAHHRNCSSTIIEMSVDQFVPTFHWPITLLLHRQLPKL